MVLRNVASHAAPVDPGHAGLGKAGNKEFDEGCCRSLGRAWTQTFFSSRRAAGGDLRFKHALFQDSAYDSLLKSRRQTLHQRAAEALIEANEKPEAVARHFTEAGLDNLAIEWSSKAGENALRRSAYKEAIVHLGRAIAMAEKSGASA